MRLDQAQGEADQQENEQSHRQSDAHGQSPHGARRSFPILQQIMERRSEAADDDHKHDDNDDFQATPAR